MDDREPKEYTVVVRCGYRDGDFMYLSPCVVANSEDRAAALAVDLVAKHHPKFDSFEIGAVFIGRHVDVLI